MCTWMICSDDVEDYKYNPAQEEAKENCVFFKKPRMVLSVFSHKIFGRTADVS
jgi:hypothetical protein